MKTIQKYYPLILAIIVILIAWRIITNIRHSAEISKAISADRITRLESDNAVLLSDTTAIHTSNRALESDNSYLIAALHQSEAKRSQIALKLEIERSKLSAESDSGTVRRFLDQTGYKSLPVQKYDSLYLIPASSAKQSNIERAELAASGESNRELTGQIGMQSGHINNLNAEVSNKDKEITILNSVNENHVTIESELKSEVKAERKKFRGQRVKTVLVGIGGVIGIIVTVLIIK